MFFKIGVLNNFTYSQENTYVGVCFIKMNKLYQKESLKQVFSYEYCETF